MIVGRVKWFNDKKGFGFITSDDKKEIDKMCLILLVICAEGVLVC